MDLKLKYPTFDVRLKKEKDKILIQDIIRKKWLVLTPEEWVRQHLVNYLVTEKKYPASIIAIEKEIELNGQKKRFDVVVFDQKLEPLLLAECKAPYIELTSDVVAQAERYNLVLNAKVFMITNGIQEYIFAEKKQVSALPAYQ